jgi:aminoglycoside phosphotransferase (APT) family kinase protein
MRRLTGEQLDEMVRTTMGTGLVKATELTGGTFNAVYRVETTDRSVVLKASPPADVPLLTYERDLLRTETRFFDLAGAVEGVKVPEVVARDFDRRLIDGDYAFLSDLPGRMLYEVSTDLPDEPRLRRELGAMMARIHRVKGTFFGYEHAAQGATWRAAFLSMLDDLLHDAARFGVPIEDVTPVVAANAHLLDAVEEPSLVHFDLWDGNVLVQDGEITGLIDGERALWGDPVAEFVSLNMFKWFEDGPHVVKGYEDEWGQRFDDDATRRLALYKIYLDLIILIEATPRGYDLRERAPLMQVATDDLHEAVRRLRT